MNSDGFTIFDFNLKALLRLSDLNLRRVAEDRKKLTAGEYYKILSEFLSVAPEVYDAVKRFADDDTNAMDWKIIKNNIPFFEKTGCDKYISDLYAIVNACEKGDHRLAANHADNIEQSFSNLYSQITAAKLKKGAGGSPDPDSTLLSCIKELDKEKADRELLVLTVDDSPAILESVSAVLSGEYKVFKLPKPAMLEDVLKKITPDLFLLDYQMPELSGFDLIPVIRGLNEHKDTPIIFLTSEGTVDNITAAVGLGACDFIVKPFNPDQLREKVAKHIIRK